MQETVKQLQAQLQQASERQDETQAATEQIVADNSALLRTLRSKLDEAHASAAADAERLEEAATNAEVMTWPIIMLPHPLPAHAAMCKWKQRDLLYGSHE